MAPAILARRFTFDELRSAWPVPVVRRRRTARPRPGGTISAIQASRKAFGLAAGIVREQIFSFVSFLILDEAAGIPDFVYYSLRLMLVVSGGDLLAFRTLGRERAFYFEACFSTPSTLVKRTKESLSRHAHLKYRCASKAVAGRLKSRAGKPKLS